MPDPKLRSIFVQCCRSQRSTIESCSCCGSIERLGLCLVTSIRPPRVSINTIHIKYIYAAVFNTYQLVFWFQNIAKNGGRFHGNGVLDCFHLIEDAFAEDDPKFLPTRCFGVLMEVSFHFGICCNVLCHQQSFGNFFAIDSFVAVSFPESGAVGLVVAKLYKQNASVLS